MGTSEHRHGAIKSIRAAVITVTSSRTLASDDSGNWIAKALAGEGHQVVDHRIAPDEVRAIAEILDTVISRHAPHAVIVNGGTGITAKDVTIEAVVPLFDKQLPAFSALFAQLSYDQIDAAAVLSRAAAGTIGKTLVFLIPGSVKACKLALKALILPDLGHFASHVTG